MRGGDLPRVPNTKGSSASSIVGMGPGRNQGHVIRQGSTTQQAGDPTIEPEDMP